MKHHLIKFLLVTSCATLALSTSAVAQTPSIQVEHFEPLPGQGKTSILNIARSETLSIGTPSFGVLMHYANDPLKVTANNDSSQVIARLIDNQLMAEVALGIGLLDRFDLGLVLPIVLFQDGDPLNHFNRSDSVDGLAISDLRIIPKFKLFLPEETHGFGVSFMLPIYLPTGSDTSFRTDSAARLEPRIIVDWRHKSGFTVAGNLAYQIRPGRNLSGVGIDDALRYGLGATTPLGVDFVRLSASFFGNLSTVNDFDSLGKNTASSSMNPVEALAALEVDVHQNLMFTLGGGSGLSSDIGAASPRIFAGLSFTPSAAPKVAQNEASPCQGNAHREDGCAKLDADHDGILDDVDQCKDVAEDMDGFEDKDGCPDLDNDQDGIPDHKDQCKHSAEDKDNFEDEDGCPDLDNDQDGINDINDACKDKAGDAAQKGCPILDADQDGILDDVDKCKDAAEDKDGFKDEDGCPDLDNDGDGIADTEDACTLQPGIAQKNPKQHGCPKNSKVRITTTRIDIRGKIFFATNRANIQSKSFKLLNELAQVLKKHPEINKIRIEGHTDDLGKDEQNLTLSTQRAQSVKDYLIKKGVQPNVLNSKGFGETAPLCTLDIQLMGKRSRDKTVKSCREQNRRVTFKVLEFNGKPMVGDTVIIKKETTKKPTP